MESGAEVAAWRRDHAAADRGWLRHVILQKYKELQKEIEEKTKLMESQLSAKDGSTATME